MAEFEIDVDLCLKNRKVFIVTNTSKTLKKFVMASFLGELQWEAKEKLDLNTKSKILLCLEKDGTPVDNEGGAGDKLYKCFECFLIPGQPGRLSGQ